MLGCLLILEQLNRELTTRSNDERSRAGGESEDKDDEQEKEKRRKIIGSIEGVDIRDMNLGKGVNDDPEERVWAKILVQAIDSGMDESEVSKMFDELTGLELDPKEVKEAREEEMSFVKGLRVYEERPIEGCWDRTGKNPIGTRWVDILKGGADNEQVGRPRLQEERGRQP